jgi:hypothetical protein
MAITGTGTTDFAANTIAADETAPDQLKRQVVLIGTEGADAPINVGTILGALTEAAPASDTASSGLNGRLQRIAQRLTTLLPAALGAGGGLKVDGSGTPLPVSQVASGAITNRSGTITAGGTAQQLAAANATRRYLLVQNASVRVLWVSPDTTAVAGSPSIALKACMVANDGTGGAIEWTGAYVPPGAISIIGATTGDAFCAKEAG